MFFTQDECLRHLPKIRVPSKHLNVDSLLVQLGVKKKWITEEDAIALIQRQKNTVVSIIDTFLDESYKKLEPGYPIEQLDFDNVKSYIEYLKHYTEAPEWWLRLPQKLHEWTYDGCGMYE